MRRIDAVMTGITGAARRITYWSLVERYAEKRWKRLGYRIHVATGTGRPRRQRDVYRSIDRHHTCHLPPVAIGTCRARCMGVCSTEDVGITEVTGITRGRRDTSNVRCGINGYHVGILALVARPAGAGRNTNVVILRRQECTVTGNMAGQAIRRNRGSGIGYGNVSTRIIMCDIGINSNRAGFAGWTAMALETVACKTIS